MRKANERRNMDGCMDDRDPSRSSNTFDHVICEWRPSPYGKHIPAGMPNALKEPPYTTYMCQYKVHFVYDRNNIPMV